MTVRVEGRPSGELPAGSEVLFHYPGGDATVLEVLVTARSHGGVGAHEHVAVNPDFFGARAMGHYLREALGNDYLALGMLFHEGPFLARTWGERCTNRVAEFRIGRAGEGHVERSFAGRALGIIDTAKVRSAKGAEPARYWRFLGSLFDHDECAARGRVPHRLPPTDFDFIAWLPNTRAARYVGAVTPHLRDWVITTSRAELFNRWAESYDRSLLDAEGFPFGGYQQVLHRLFTLVEPRPGLRVLDLALARARCQLFASAAAVSGIDFAERCSSERVGRSRRPHSLAWICWVNGRLRCASGLSM